MFWDKNDSPSQNIEALLEKENVTVEEFLDEDDIIQECKTLKKSIVNYFTRPEVIKRMIEIIITEPPEDLPVANRFRLANVACEILLIGLPSLDEKLLADVDTLNLLYSYLENEPPLNPLLASFFSKTFSMLFTKKSDQDWFLYQQLCLKLLEYLKTQSNFLDLICKHFTTPVIPDLIMEMMRNVEGGQLKRSLYEWLNDEKLVEKLIDIIGDPEQSEKHANVAEFLCDLIQQGRTMRQCDQDNDSFEPIFDGSNPILKNIESATTLFALFNVILQPNALESAIVSGIMIVLKIIKPVVAIDEPNSDRLKFLQDREKEIHDELLSTVIRVIEPQLKRFNELLRNPPKKPDIVISAAVLSPPFGMTRLQICRLFTVLLQTNNEEISKAICDTDFFEILLSLFKQYCWNNFLHSEVEKCLQTIFYSALANNTNNNSTHVSNGSQKNNFNLGDNVFDNIFINNHNTGLDVGAHTPKDNDGSGDTTEEGRPSTGETAEQLDVSRENNEEGDTTKAPADLPPSAIQTHLIVDCNLITKLIECWTINREIETAEKGHRLGYMGHLIKIFKHITNCISESEHIGALVDSNHKDDAERELWQSIVNSTDGELTHALNIQSKLLANCEACDYDISLDFLTDNDFSGAFNTLCAITDPLDTDVIFTLDYNTQHDSDDEDGEGDGSDDNNENSIEDQRNNHQVKNALNLFQFGRSNDDDEDDDDENASADALTGYVQPSSKLTSFTVTSNPWDTNDDFFKSATSSVPWAPDCTGDNFADFDAHFSSFANDMGECLTASARNDNIGDCPAAARPDEGSFQLTNATTSEEYDNNANVEKSSWSADFSSFQLKKDNMPFTTQNFIDDYEDDEGMWTKPLGGSAFNVEDEQQTHTTEKTAASEAGADEASHLTHFTNGPTNPMKNEVEKADRTEIPTNQLNNAEITLPAEGEEVKAEENITTISRETNRNEDNEISDLQNVELDLTNKLKSIETEAETTKENATTLEEAKTNTTTITTTTDDSTVTAT